jgi:hypothetical protein
MVGLPRGEVTHQDLIEDEELDVCSPYYDGDGEDDAIAGFTYESSGDFCATEINIDLDVIEALKCKFKRITGQDARVYLSPRGW